MKLKQEYDANLHKQYLLRMKFIWANPEFYDAYQSRNKLHHQINIKDIQYNYPQKSTE